MSLKRTELAALALVLAAAAFVSGYMLGKDNVNIEISTAGSQSIGVDSHSEASDDGTLKSLPGDSGPSTLPADGGLIDLNSAASWELEMLPGIGPVLAERVVEYRDEHGPFRDKSEIKNVEGIGEGIYEDIQDYIAVTED